MLSIFDSSVSMCDRISRREILRASGAGLIGLPALGTQLLGANEERAKRAKACIVLFLMGGPPQHSTWDPKPDAPAGIRGEFGPIDTNVPGVQIGELMPRTARLMDKIAVLRAVATDDNAHSSSGYAMLTGQPHIPKNVEGANPGAPNNWPTMGAVAKHLYHGRQLLPAAVRLPQHIFNTDQSIWPGQDAGWLGKKAEPWLFNCRPASPDFDVTEFRLQADVSLDRLNNRRSLLNQIEYRLRLAEVTGAVNAFTERQQQAFALLDSPMARTACDIKEESKEVRDRYGRGQFGQSVLLARRLVEAEVKFVQVNWFRGPDEPRSNPVWDTHNDEPNRLKNVLVPPFDQAYTALLEDLEQRGTLDETLVVVMAEFGRTPKINAAAGRGHWGYVFSVALAGCGIRGGTVYGASDEIGGYPKEGRVDSEDVTATIFHCLGYPPHTEIHDPLGRALPISRGQVIRQIL